MTDTSYHYTIAYEADLEWEDASDGVGLIEVNSDLLDMWIEPLYGEGKYKWALFVTVREGIQYDDYAFLKGGDSMRSCVDLSHAWYLADSFEREINRRVVPNR